MTTMDAQEITFNQDPEAGATDIDSGKDSGCCCKVICCPCKVFYWYIAPLTCELCHTIKCFFFHPFNFAMGIFLLVWDATLLSVGLGLIGLCCMGIPLLWITVETIIAFSRFDLGFNYYFVETKKKFDESRAHLLKLSLYSTDVPLCCCYNHSSENCMNLMFERMKYLFTEIQVYKYILFHILIRPIITFSTWWICIIVGVNVALCGTPIWYLSNDTQFKCNQVSPTWWAYDKCDWVDIDGCTDKGLDCSTGTHHVWILNDFGDALTFGLLCLIVLPITMRINNWFAHLNKVAAYKFYTWYYIDDPSYIQDKQPMLRGNTARIDSV